MNDDDGLDKLSPAGRKLAVVLFILFILFLLIALALYVQG